MVTQINMTIVYSIVLLVFKVCGTSNYLHVSTFIELHRTSSIIVSDYHKSTRNTLMSKSYSKLARHYGPKIGHFWRVLTADHNSNHRNSQENRTAMYFTPRSPRV